MAVLAFGGHTRRRGCRRAGVNFLAPAPPTAQVARRAASWHLSESPDPDVQGAAAALLQSAPPPGTASFGLLMVPRARAKDAPALAAAVSARFGSAAPVIAFISGGQRLALCVATGLSDKAHAFTLSPGADAPALPAGEVGSGSRTILVFAEPSAPAGFLSRSLFAIGGRWPDGVVAGMQVAPSTEAGSASVWVGGAAITKGGLAGLVLPGCASVGIDLLGCQPVGEDLEVFEADIRKGAPVTVIKIGTDEEGDMREAAETEKGTAGIARRVDVPAAAAMKSVMAEAKLGGPKEVFVGLPRQSPPTQGGPLAAKWSIVNWVGVSKTGGVVLGGGDPLAENLCPKGSLRCIQPFRVAPAAGGWRQLAAAASGSQVGQPYAALALAAGRGISPREGEAAVGVASPCGALGVSILGAAGGGDPAIHRQAGAVILLRDG